MQGLSAWLGHHSVTGVEISRCNRHWKTSGKIDDGDIFVTFCSFPLTYPSIIPWLSENQEIWLQRSLSAFFFICYHYSSCFKWYVCTNHSESFPKQALVVTCLQYKSFENTVQKGKIARKRAISPFPSLFNLFGELSSIFIKFKIDFCKLFHFERV